MERVNPKFDKTLSYMIYGSLMVLAIGLVTSTSLLALFHILICVPAFYFLNKADYKKFPISAWALLAMTLIIAISIIFNHDIAVKGYAPLSKTKYFLFGFLSIAPFVWYFKTHWDDKKISRLIYVFCIATTFATLVGIFSRYWEFNPVTWRTVSAIRNAGLFGMVMNYAHNLSYFIIIITGLVINRNKIKQYVSSKFIFTVWAINLIGLYLTYTRGAWLAFFVALPFFVFKNNKKYFMAVIIGACLIGGVFYKVAGKAIFRPKSEMQRISQWQAAVEAFKERPILGFGYLNFEEHSRDIKKRYDLPEKDFGGHAHSNIFEMIGSTGGLGILSFIAWIFFWFKEMYDREDIIAQVGIPFIVVFFVGGLTQSTISLGINLFFILAVYSLSVVCSIKRRSS